MFGLGPAETVVLLGCACGVPFIVLAIVIIVVVVKKSGNNTPMMPPTAGNQMGGSAQGAPSPAELATYHGDGSKLTSVNGSILLGGAPVSLEQIVEYDKKGLLGWTSNEARAWTLGAAVSAPAAPPTGPTQPSSIPPEAGE